MKKRCTTGRKTTYFDSQHDVLQKQHIEETNSFHFVVYVHANLIP